MRASVAMRGRIRARPITRVHTRAGARNGRKCARVAVCACAPATRRAGMRTDAVGAEGGSDETARSKTELGSGEGGPKPRIPEPNRSDTLFEQHLASRSGSASALARLGVLPRSLFRPSARACLEPSRTVLVCRRGRAANSRILRAGRAESRNSSKPHCLSAFDQGSRTFQTCRPRASPRAAEPVRTAWTWTTQPQLQHRAKRRGTVLGSTGKHGEAREGTGKQEEARPFARSELCAGHAAPAHAVSNLTDANVDGALAFAPEPEAAA
jgi:hypothetical protein